MTAHDGGAPPPGAAPATPSGDAVPDFTQKAQENAHRQSITEYAQQVLGLELAPWQKRYLEELATITPELAATVVRRESVSRWREATASALTGVRLVGLETAVQSAAAAAESGELDQCITHLDEALRLAHMQRAIAHTTEGQP